MNFFRSISSTALNFIFPSSEKALQLEELSTSEMIQLFPSPSSLPEYCAAIFDYKDSRVKDMVWEIKYRGNQNLARKAADLMYEIISDELSERALFENFKNPILIPMPMSGKRQREKGFNQTELICKEIVKLDESTYLEYDPKILKKVRHTESQTRTETKKARLENLRGTMEVLDTEKLQNRSVVLIDDVITTGASVLEARRALKQGGAQKVLAVALAH